MTRETAMRTRQPVDAVTEVLGHGRSCSYRGPEGESSPLTGKRKKDYRLATFGEISAGRPTRGVVGCGLGSAESRARRRVALTATPGLPAARWGLG
jgi:hypothetical protein